MKKQSTSFWARWCAIFFVPVAIHAHPGHGFEEHGPVHWLTSPDHLACLALVGVGLWALGFVLKNKRRLCRYTGTGIMLLAALLYTMSLT
jgi:hydrogenase/urease accessory protein HupE